MAFRLLDKPVNAVVQTSGIPRNNQRYTRVHGVDVVPICSMESVGGAHMDDERRLMMPEVIQIPKTLPMELRVRVVENYARKNDKDYYRGDYQKYLPSTWVEPKKFLTDRRGNHVVSP